MIRAKNGSLVWFRSDLKLFGDMWDRGCVKMDDGWAWIQKRTQTSNSWVVGNLRAKCRILLAISETQVDGNNDDNDDEKMFLWYGWPTKGV